jgi:hypothetical protein
MIVMVRFRLIRRLTTRKNRLARPTATLGGGLPKSSTRQRGAPTSGRRAASSGGRVAGASVVDLRAGDLSRGLMGLDIQRAAIAAAVGSTSVEVLLPEGGSGRQLFCSGGSVVLRVDPVGGPPYVDFTDEGDARRTARPSPDRRRALVRVYLDVSGEVGDQPGALGKIRRPKRDDHEALPVYREATAAVRGQ